MTTSISHTMSFKVWAMLIILSVLWGGSFFFVGVAVNELPPFTIVTLRVAIAAIILWGIAFILGHRPPKQMNVWISFFAIGLLNNVVPFVLIAWGQTQVASGIASILNAATPIFTVIIAGIMLPDERPSILKIIGAGIGLTGVVVMIGVPTFGGEGKLLAQIAIVIATISYAFAGVYGRRFKSMKINPIITAAGQVTASTFILIPVTLFIDGPVNVQDINTNTWGAVICLAIFSTAIAYVLYFRILELAGATNLLLVTMLIPISAILLGSLFLNESLTAIHFLGMGLIALGLSAIDGRIWKKVKLALMKRSALSCEGSK